MKLIYTLFLLLLLVLPSCNQTDIYQKKQQRTVKGEFIYRYHHEILFSPPIPRHVVRENYPWEKKFIGKHPLISKEFFRCKGNGSNPAQVFTQNGKEPIRYFDCGGMARHGLPIENGKEFIYPCLIDILNYIQEKTERQVIITSGHRCPQHNTYCDSSKENWGSKHMIGGEVDFYVHSMEDKPLEIVALIHNYYKDNKNFKELKDYTQFLRYEKNDTHISTQPWYNKEIFIKLFKKTEGRNFDNKHSYPYLSIQVRMDREHNTKVVYDSKKAQNFLRY